MDKGANAFPFLLPAAIVTAIVNDALRHANMKFYLALTWRFQHRYLELTVNYLTPGTRGQMAQHMTNTPAN